MSAVDSRSANVPQLPTRIRRWRSYQPASNIVFENDLGPDNASQTQSARPLRKGIELEFVNIAHPLDATTSTTISNIRSHAARDIHASRRASALRLKGGQRKIRMKVDTGGDSHLSLASPVNITIPIHNGFLHCCARPITKLEQFLLDYCKWPSDEPLNGFHPYVPLTYHRCNISHPKRRNVVSPWWRGATVPSRRDAALASLYNHRQWLVGRYFLILMS